MSKELTLSDVALDKNAIINEKQFNFLFRKTPQHNIYSRPAKGGGHWQYVTGVYVKKVLNFVCGFNWSFEILDEKVVLEAKQVIVKGKLTCVLNGNEIVKMQYGRKDVIFRKGTQIPLDLGNDLKAAATDALKKCASELGVASDIYGANEFKEVQIVEKSLSSQYSSVELQTFEAEIQGCNDGDELDMWLTAREIDLKNIDPALMKILANRKKEIENGK